LSAKPQHRTRTHANAHTETQINPTKNANFTETNTIRFIYKYAVVCRGSHGRIGEFCSAQL